MSTPQQEKLLQELKLQPAWLLWAYIVIGAIGIAAGVTLRGITLDAILCVGGGFFLALGAEKMVSMRVREAAVAMLTGGARR